MDALLNFRPLLWQGFVTTLIVTVLGAAVALFIAFAVGVARYSRRRILSVPAAVFIEVFRGTSLVVQMFWLFYVFPFFGINLPPMVTAVIALGFNEGAYAAEIVRSALKAVPKGQDEASIALSLSPRRTLWRIKMPQAIAIMLPSLGNILIDLFKNTSLVSLVTVVELTFAAQQIRTSTGQTFAVYGFLLVVYFIVSFGIGRGVAFVERVVGRRYGTRPVKASPLSRQGGLA
ncbi:ectoine/hydroxyectoine ABC transporter permease subunit EhuC [Acidipropionibacterium jensenii]|uniref:Ectoine/hydroxyectoine ABC transporter permease subunit EhuC n=1 Tax=Acidipropionibacterium jensenii TaxID=1749 RepID=A0A3Q9UIS4_9ACTN|nr:ectoine/hydroxyectoine ABC transporter permease subunit EhuC [Acidipropionibacterium jensenii]AZZ38556.1 ectoine/hydroxyectoine ABC transporter permease subunit EhuC [Acidipropionibacterium jensenii]